jgi:RNA polymerase sigma-70 factor (ECF subfamily)
MSTYAVGLEVAMTGEQQRTRPGRPKDPQGLPMTLVPPATAPPAKPNSGLFKRNPPIAGEAEAIEAAKNGDPEAFSKLYALHKRRVYTLCLRMLGNVSEAEDMTQEAFLHLFRKLGSFRGESAFSTWLHRLTVNLVLMHLRKKGLNLVSLEETINPSEDDAPKRDFGSRDPQLSGSVDRVALERAVASLPPGYRMVFVLHDVEGFEHNEIATMLECSTGNSKSQLHKARLKLRELLRQPGQSNQPGPAPGLKEIVL